MSRILIKQILFICDAMPFSENSSGAASFKYAHLKLLLTTYPDAFIHIVILNYYKTDEFNAKQLEIEFPVDRYRIEMIHLLPYKVNNLKRQSRIFSLNLHAIRYFHSFINAHTLALFQKTIDKIGYDLIWTEHAIPNYFAICSRAKAPIVYVHHDFLWKLQKLKQGVASKKKRLLTRVLRISEISQLRKNKYIVSGSQSEIAEIESINSRAMTALLPTTYKSLAVSGIIPFTTRIVHVGNMLATANKIGLSRFLTVCWPVLCQLDDPPELWIIGKVDTGHSQEVMKLLQQPNINVLGHVEDLSTVLRPYDIHIIPYEYDTGTRTRIPLALNHQQILLSTRNGSKGMLGLQDQMNCLLVDSLEEMVSKITHILKDKMPYIKIADQGKAYFESNFTVESQRNKLISFLQQIN
jgi:hypothetical protein